MTSKWISRRLLTLLLTVFLCTVVQAAEESEPWGLRDHYIFKGMDSVLLVDAKRAEWRLENSKGQAIIPEAYTELELGDGKRIRITKDHWITDGRDSFKDAFGKGYRFRSEFKPIDGLHVEFHLNRYDEQPFMTMMVTLRNTGKTPISLRAIRSGIVDSGSAPLFTRQNIIMSHAHRRGVHTLPMEKGKSNFMEVRLPGSKEIVGLGLLQSGFMDSHLYFNPESKGSTGFIENSFSPTIDIMPNKTAQTDAVWIMLSMTDSAGLHDFYTWTEAFIRKDERRQHQPLGWITIPDDAPIETLLETAHKWNVKSIQHALVPGTWQTGGITEGRYMMSVAEVSRKLKETGLAPGITVDPLSAESKFKNYTVQAKDGSFWLDLRLPKARKYGVKQLQRLVEWKYEFFAVSLSSIPDDALQTMNITRAIADLVAFEMMTEAAGSIPVFPSSALTIGNDIADWDLVRHATGPHKTYHLSTGPIRLDVRNVKRLSEPVKNSVMGFCGPLEIVGLPGKLLRQQLNDSFAIALAPPADPETE